MCPVAAVAGVPAPPETGGAGIINFNVGITRSGLFRAVLVFRNGRHAISHAAS
jgi:hypothetical protein